MSTDVFSLLRQHERNFSKGQRAIARYITECYDKAAFMTASKLGKTVEVSESTVVRFAVELGFDGYPALQKAMQEMVLNRLTSVQRIEVANDRLIGRDVVTTVLNSDMEKLRQTAETLNRDDFQAAVDATLQARRVYILGVRSAAPLANFLGYYLRHMLGDVRVVTASGTSEMFEQIIGVDSRDAVLAFSFPRYSTSTAEGAKFCRANGAKVIGITDSRFSPLGCQSDHVLTCKSDMISLVDSLTAPLSVANALIVAIASHRGRELEKTLGALEQVWEEYHVYERREGTV